MVLRTGKDRYYDSVQCQVVINLGKCTTWAQHDQSPLIFGQFRRRYRSHLGGTWYFATKRDCHTPYICPLPATPREKSAGSQTWCLLIIQRMTASHRKHVSGDTQYSVYQGHFRMSCAMLPQTGRSYELSTRYSIDYAITTFAKGDIVLCWSMLRCALLYCMFSCQCSRELTALTISMVITLINVNILSFLLFAVLSFSLAKAKTNLILSLVPWAIQYAVLTISMIFLFDQHSTGCVLTKFATCVPLRGARRMSWLVCICEITRAQGTRTMLPVACRRQ